MEKEFEPMAIFFNEIASKQSVAKAIFSLLGAIDTEREPHLRESRDLVATFVETML